MRSPDSQSVTVPMTHCGWLIEVHQVVVYTGPAAGAITRKPQERCSLCKVAMVPEART